MFFQADAINNVLICKICDTKMVYPRILPCGKSICHRCVDLIADTEKKRIKCENCAKIHEIPDEGFPKNLALEELLEFEAKEVLPEAMILYHEMSFVKELSDFFDTINSIFFMRLKCFNINLIKLLLIERKIIFTSLIDKENCLNL